MQKVSSFWKALGRTSAYAYAREGIQKEGVMEQELISFLKNIGQLWHILIGYHSEIIDREHRFSLKVKWRARKSWEKPV